MNVTIRQAQPPPIASVHASNAQAQSVWSWQHFFVFFSALFLLTTCLTISGCKSIPTHKPIAPKVSIAAVKPLNLSLSGQKLKFTLRVINPNAFDLPLRSLDFIASVGGKDFAKGVSQKAVTIPGKGEALVDVEVVAGLSKLFGQLKSMAKTKKFDLDYGVQGSVKLDNWPTAIPFDVTGELESPSLD